MYQIQDGVAVITLDQPPVNALGAGLRQRLFQQLDAAQADGTVRAIVLRGNDKAFSAGADVTEFGMPKQLEEPILRTLTLKVESSGKAVVAAISGAALGGGLELALACHGRVALGSARVGMPEIKLGLVPGSGGTQRLPRLMGVEAAQTLMFSGQARTAQQMASSGLFDQVVNEDATGSAVQLALALADKGQPYPRARDRNMNADAVRVAVDAQRSKLNARQLLQPAYEALLDAVAAGVLPFEDGLQVERALFLCLQETSAARALRYQFKAEGEAGKLPPAMQATPRKVQQVAVIGAGTMGSGIAIALLDAGLPVLLLEQDGAALERGKQRIADYYADRVKAGKLQLAAASDNLQRLNVSLAWEDLQQVDLVIEAVFEELGVKQEVFRKIDAYARSGAVLATNTSYLDIDAIAAATSRPEDVLGLHFFSPAQVMKLLEVVQGEKTSAEVLATGLEIGAALKKVAVPTGNNFGFIGNRVYNAYRRQCEFMLEDGAWPEDVDAAMTGFGMAMGPFAVADLSGLDIAWRMRKAQAATRDLKERYVAILDELCEKGRLGRKTGAGYYNYEGTRQVPVPDECVRDVIARASEKRGILRQTLSQEFIVRRVLLAMAWEASLLVAEGVAARPADVDVAMVQGYGFPRWEGGPVFWARQQDRLQLEADLKTLADEAGMSFMPASLDSILGD